jgi:cytochrome c oxidase cbb3-type subunit 2
MARLSTLPGVLLMAILSPAALADGSARRGATLYQGSCMACHGVNADGNGPAAGAMTPRPTNLAAASYWKERTDAQVAATIRSGSPGTSMMPFAHLSEEQVSDLVVFLKTKAPQPSPSKSKPALKPTPSKP